MAALFPQVEVGVALIMSGDKVLVAFNPRWGTFSLPMSKQRTLEDPRVPLGKRTEEWHEAAARAAAEILGRTLVDFPSKPVADVPEYQQSDSDFRWKRYHFQVFRIDVGPDRKVAPCVAAEWLTTAEMTEDGRVPVSKTARDLVTEVLLNPARTPRRPGAR